MKATCQFDNLKTSIVISRFFKVVSLSLICKLEIKNSLSMTDGNFSLFVVSFISQIRDNEMSTFMEVLRINCICSAIGVNVT